MGDSLAYESCSGTNVRLNGRWFVLGRSCFRRDRAWGEVWLYGRFHRYKETITAAGDRSDVFRTVRRIAKGLPKLLDCSVNAVVELDYRIVRPKSFADLLAVNQVSAALDQHQQDLERLFLEQDFAVFSAEFSCTEVEFELCKAHTG
jgi:hypothetical protein